MRQVFSVVRYNFRGFFKNPKVILTVLLGIVLCYDEQCDALLLVSDNEEKVAAWTDGLCYLRGICLYGFLAWIFAGIIVFLLFFIV
ncbi:MAG: hypothetical protein E7244_06075 [Enterocloster citroniae]|nr:hypothetical protein [Enterocloster citroniae]